MKSASRSVSLLLLTLAAVAAPALAFSSQHLSALLPSTARQQQQQAPRPTFQTATTVPEFRFLLGNSTAEQAISVGNGTIVALLAVDIARAETPEQVHQILVFFAALWEPHAACHPRARGFLGARVPIAPHLCATPARVHALAGLVLQRVYARAGYAARAARATAFLTALGIAAGDLAAADTATMQGWAGARARALVAYFDNDGWNWRGADAVGADADPQPYADTTRYWPLNTGPRSRRPLRWRPLRVRDGDAGRYYLQVHTFPHIGWRARPLAVPTAQLHARRLRGPYARPDAAGNWTAVLGGGADNATVQAGLDALLRRQRDLTRQRLYEALWWDSKTASLGFFANYYEGVYKLREFDALQLSLGELLAQHDAVLAAWRAKRQHDLVRPVTLMRALRAGTRAQALVRGELRLREVDLGGWTALLAEQGHSEFPSGSAALCRASMDHLQIAVELIAAQRKRERTGKEDAKGVVPPFELDLSRVAAALNLEPPFRVRFDTLEQAYKSCGESRLWGGVHFPPAVEKGYEVVEGFGRAAFEHMRDLAAGKKPAVCERCA